MKKKKIRVLQVNKLYAPFTGGVEQIVRQIAEGLSGKVDMRVLVCRESGKTIYEKQNQVRICRAASIGMIGNLPIPIALLSQFKKYAKSADIIQFHMPFPFGDLAGLFSGYSGKMVVWYHSDVVRQKKLMFFYRPIMERFLQRADRIIVATEGHIEGSNYLAPYRKKCVVIPFGADRFLEERADRYWEQKQIQEKKLRQAKAFQQKERERQEEAFQQKERERQAAAFQQKERGKQEEAFQQKERERQEEAFQQKERGRQEEVFQQKERGKQEEAFQQKERGKQTAAFQEKKGLRFLFVGRLVYYKGCKILLEAFACLRRESCATHQLVLVGSGVMEKELKALAKQKGILNAVRFAGEVTKEQLYQEYEACDVFVLPSIARSEAFGLVQIEAMAFGKPVINTRLNSGVPYVSLDRITGLTVTPNQVTELKDAMLYMEQHPQERKEMGERARQRMKQEYRETVMLDRLFRLYQELLKENEEGKEEEIESSI